MKSISIAPRKTIPKTNVTMTMVASSFEELTHLFSCSLYDDKHSLQIFVIGLHTEQKGSELQPFWAHDPFANP